MQAAIINATGGLDQVTVTDVPSPALERPDDVIVSMRAAALNHLDLFVVHGLPGLPRAFPHVLGADGAGVVEAVGSAVKRFQPGDRVALNPGLWCGACEWCRAGEEPLCVSYGILGEHHPGTFAEAVRVPERNLAHIPEGATWGEAAAFPLVTLTAWRMVASKGAVAPGHTVLIWGIGGGVALAALAIAKHLGARVFVTSSSDEKLARAKSLGADQVINHARADVGKEVRRLTGKRGCDVVIDNVGEATWETSLRSLVRGGRLVTCGGTSGPMLTTDVRRLFWYQYAIHGSTMGNAVEFDAIMQRFGRGELAPVIDRAFPLAEARAALAHLEAGKQFGKVVLEIAA